SGGRRLADSGRPGSVPRPVDHLARPPRHRARPDRRSGPERGSHLLELRPRGVRGEAAGGSMVAVLGEEPAGGPGRGRAPGGALGSGDRLRRRGANAEAPAGTDREWRWLVAGRGTGRRAGVLVREGAAAAPGPPPDLVARGAVPGDGGDRSASDLAGAASRDR